MVSLPNPYTYFIFVCCPHQSKFNHDASGQHPNFIFEFRYLIFEFFKSKICPWLVSSPIQIQSRCIGTTFNFHFRISIFEFRIFKSNICPWLVSSPIHIQYPNFIFEFRYLNFEFLLLPFNSSRWFAANIIHHTVNAFYFIDNAVRYMR